MNCFIKNIGIIDKNEKIHQIEFFQGLNIVTGKSSTGKSAIIEIFDYCFGSSEYTIPEGIIRERAYYYFVILQFQSFYLVLARSEQKSKSFIKEILKEKCHCPISIIKFSFFDKLHFLSIDNFKKELGRYFGISLTYISEKISDNGFKDRKNPTLSVRSFSSFMLQHQNLIANKHAIFFRFDEKEKREQAIEHFKIFLGVVDQGYFIILKKINDLVKEIKYLKLEISNRKKNKKSYEDKISDYLIKYNLITGNNLLEESAIEIGLNPKKYLNIINNNIININFLNSKYSETIDKLDKELLSISLKIRRIENKKNSIKSSINISNEFEKTTDSFYFPDKIEYVDSNCPFCYQQSNLLEKESNQLGNAINWLNNELQTSSYIQRSFLEEIDNLELQIKKEEDELNKKTLKLEEIKKQNIDLERNDRSPLQLAIKWVVKIESTLESLLEEAELDLLIKKENLEKELEKNRSEIGKYNADYYMNKISYEINKYMNEIGKNFEFESSFKPINLKFSTETFEIYNENKSKNENKVFLRSMGSGANWLYCHLSLFLALHRLFAGRAMDGCMIPPILFLDQPSQVYFPNFINDRGNEFNPKELAKNMGRSDKIDEDLQAVINMYKQLIDFCDITKKQTNILPQIIVTDHADNLDLGKGYNFNSYVRARWRERGFID